MYLTVSLSASPFIFLYICILFTYMHPCQCTHIYTYIYYIFLHLYAHKIQKQSIKIIKCKNLATATYIQDRIIHMYKRYLTLFAYNNLRKSLNGAAYIVLLTYIIIQKIISLYYTSQYSVILIPTHIYKIISSMMSN